MRQQVPMTARDDKTAREAREDQAIAKHSTCPDCGSVRGIPIIHGIPQPSQNNAIQKGEAVRADREEWEGMTEWYCKQCGCDWSGSWSRFKKPPHSQ